MSLAHSLFLIRFPIKLLRRQIHPASRAQLYLLLAISLAGASASADGGNARDSVGGAPIHIALDAEFGHITSTSDDAIRMGILTAIDEINESGGLLGGRPLALLETDNRSIPARGRDNFSKLADAGDVVAVFCGKFSPVCLEQARIADTLELPLLDPWAAADGIISERPAGTYRFRLSLRDSWAIPAMLRHLQSAGIGSVGVMLPTTGWGRSNELQVRKHVTSGVLPVVVGIEWYDWGTRSVIDQYESLLGHGAESILFVGNEGEGSLLVREVAALPAPARVPIVSHWGVSGGNFIELAGPSLDAVDFAVIQTFTFEGLASSRAGEVLARAGKLFGIANASDIPSHVGFAHAYDLTLILGRAIAIAGSSDRTMVRDALEQVEDVDGLVRHYFRPFSPSSHEALSAATIFIGRFLPSGTVGRF